MYAVEVMPIQRGVLKGSFTFFSREFVPAGSVVSAPIRKRMVPSLVIRSEDVRSQKLDIKEAGYALKKLGTAAPRRLFSDALMRAIAASAHYYVADDGAVLAQLSFSALLTNPRSLSAPPASRKDSARIKPEVLVLQAEHDERMQSYKNLVRECFARNQSVLIIAPTLIEVEELTAQLERGIEDRVFSVTSQDGARALRRVWEKTATATEALLLIGTPAALSFPLQNIDAVIVEREGARSYVARTRPTIDLRRAAESVAAEAGARFILADFPVRVETYARVREGTADDMARPQVRTRSPASINLLDVRQSDKVKEERRSFSALQPSTYDTMASALAAGGRAVVFAARRGIAPLTICNDCGTPITDEVTNTPMVLHKTPRGNVFISHRSGAVVAAERACTHCGGWNLVSLGIGVDRVADEVKKHFPKAEVALFTSDTAQTHKSAKRIVDEFYKTPAAILVGTERMLPYLSPGAECVVVASIDSVLSLPAWRAHEHALSILYNLYAHAHTHFIIETRRPESPVMKSVASGTPVEFLRNELKERHQYGYPPFKTFIGLEWSGTETQCLAIKQLVAGVFELYDLVGPLPPEAIDRTRFRARAVIRLDRTLWPDNTLLDLLKNLPTTIQFSVDPDDIV